MVERIRLKKWAQNNNVSYAQARRWAKCGQIKSVTIGRSIFVVENKEVSQEFSQFEKQVLAKLDKIISLLQPQQEKIKRKFVYDKQKEPYEYINEWAQALDLIGEEDAFYEEIHEIYEEMLLVLSGIDKKNDVSTESFIRECCSCLSDIIGSDCKHYDCDYGEISNIREEMFAFYREKLEK